MIHILKIIVILIISLLSTFFHLSTFSFSHFQMGKARSKGSLNPNIKNDLRREKIEKKHPNKAKGSLPSGFTLPAKGKKKVRQLAKYQGHVLRRAQAEAAALGLLEEGMEEEKQ